MSEQLLPAENMALTVALAQIARGDEVPPNTTAVLKWALARLVEETALCPICIARSQHGPPVAAQIRFLTRERDEALSEIARMQTLIDELREEAAGWRDERNHIAAQWRAATT